MVNTDFETEIRRSKHNRYRKTVFAAHVSTVISESKELQTKQERHKKVQLAAEIDLFSHIFTTPSCYTCAATTPVILLSYKTATASVKQTSTWIINIWILNWGLFGSACTARFKCRFIFDFPHKQVKYIAGMFLGFELQPKQTSCKQYLWYIVIDLMICDNFPQHSRIFHRNVFAYLCISVRLIKLNGY